jgi:signal peptidase I
MSSSDRRRSLVFKTYIESILITLFIAGSLRYFVVAPYKMPTDSMAPTIFKNDYVFVYTLPYGIDIPMTDHKIGKAPETKLGQVLLFRYKLDDQSVFIKRVWGLPGDKVEIKDSQLWVNDRLMGATPAAVKMKPTMIPPDSLFLMCDNPQLSDDSQYWSLISKDRIIGQVTHIWLSFAQGHDNEQSFPKTLQWDRIFKKVN